MRTIQGTELIAGTRWLLLLSVSTLVGCFDLSRLGGGPDAASSATCNQALMSDPMNCGACGHSCQGGGCTQGVCQPVAIATGQMKPRFLFVDASDIYWSRAGNYPYQDSVLDGAIVRLPKQGGDPMVLATGQSEPKGIAADEASVYWVTSGVFVMGMFMRETGTVMKVPKAGGDAVTLVSGQNNAEGLALDAQWVYWTTVYGGTIMRVNKAGGLPQLLAAGQSFPRDLALDDGNIYWLNMGHVMGTMHMTDGSIWKQPLAGGPPVSMAAGLAYPYSLALGGSSLYWTNLDGGTVSSIAAQGGAPMSDLATAQQQPFGIAADATNIYWTDAKSPGMVLKAPRDGGTPSVLAQGGRPAEIVIDETSIYWFDRQPAMDPGSATAPPPGVASLMKVAK